jgi:two-component system, NtrC family, sensor kinase
MPARTRIPNYAIRAAALGFSIWLAIASVAAFALWHERTQTLDYARRSAAATVALLEQHTANTFHAVTLALDDTAQQLSFSSYPQNDARVREKLRNLLHEMPYVRAIFVLDRDGAIIHDTDFPATPKVSLADRAYFVAHEEDPALVSMIGAPVMSRSGTGWFVPVTRRLSDTGTFKGVVVAAIQLRYFDDLYLRMGLHDGERIMLFHRNATLLAQYPAREGRIGESYAAYPLFRTRLPLQARGVYDGSGPPVPYDRIFSYAALDTLPLVVALSHDKEAVLAPWRRSLAFTVFGLAVVLLLLAAAVTQYVYRKAARERTRERLSQGEKLEALGQLTGGIAHDFGNMLGVIGNNLELLDRLIREKDERVTRALGSAKHAVATATGLTRDLMSFARKRELNVVALDLADAIARAEPLLRHAAGSRVEVVVSADHAVCQLDYNQLEVALINLVVNARDAIKAQGRIEIRGSAALALPDHLRNRRGGVPGYVGITVSDTGDGMPDKVKKRALEPFFTTKGENGTGLGLSQVYGFVKQVGGEMVIDSAPGKGTSVHMYFPAMQA